MYSKIAVAGILVFLLVFALLVWVLVRYREGSGHGHATHEMERHNLKLEMVWIVVPLLIVGWVGFIAYKGLVELDGGIPHEDAEMEIKVTGYQWAWEMDYGDGISVLVTTSVDGEGQVTYSDTFHVPADTPITLNVTGADVIHAFNIMDENRAYFSMHDANPYGVHKHVLQTLEFPAGEYLVQCKEMCGNPGHAYMRARIVADAPEDFALWRAHKALAVGATLVHELNVTVTEDGFAPSAPLDLATGTRIILDVDNPTGGPVNFAFGPTSGNATSGQESFNVPAGAREVFAFNVTAAGTYEVFSSNGGGMDITAVDATPVSVTLGDFSIEPENLRLEAGTTYLVTATNAHDTSHNFFIGHWDGSGPKTVLAKSADLGPGGVGSFLFTPEETGSYDTWCDVPGHYGLGMHEHATVA